MCRDIEYLFTFTGSRVAIKADSLCREHSIQVQVVTIPPRISSECGMALRVDTHNKEIVETLLNDNGIDFKLYNI